MSVEEITDEGRGYIIAESPQQYLQYNEDYVWCGEWSLGGYHWYFGQEEWTYLHPGAERPQPAPNMGIGGAQWIFMERDDILAGFSSTPVFLNLLVERGQDLPDVPRYPATTMVFNMDWMDDWTWEFMPPSYWGLQWQALVYKGSFSAEEVLTYYENVLPGYDWQMGSKFNVDIGAELGPFYIGEASGIGFWKEAEHGGVPYYTDTVRILAWEMDGIGFIAVLYVPVDIPTVPGTELTLWESAWPLGPTTHMMYGGSAVPIESINYFMEAMAKLQWDEVFYYDDPPYDLHAYFEKPVVGPWGVEWLEVEVEGITPLERPWNQEQPVQIHIERFED